ncbi:hypothetical protein DFH28DRAFT_1139055 [Melampsora americana]|nr:hypothetical protein DFH28DRAFT_1139055 [Melampsora americana]
MSHVHTSIFLPDYVLESVVDERTPRIDPESFLSKATPTKLIEVILAFYPHFKFTKSAQEDHELLRMIFVEMVALRLSNIAIPPQGVTKYIDAPYEYPAFESQEPPRSVDSAADINIPRINLFNIYCLPYLKNAQYRRATEGLETFCKKYKSLNEHELNSVGCAKEEAQEDLHDCSSYLSQCHENIEKIHLRLRHPDSRSDQKALNDRLKTAITTLRARQIMFNNSVQNVGLISALHDHYKDLFVKNQPNNSPSTSGTEESHSNAPQDT